MCVFFFFFFFHNQMFVNFQYAFNISSDAQFYVSRRVYVLFLRPRFATLRLKHVIRFCLVWLVKVS